MSKFVVLIDGKKTNDVFNSFDDAEDEAKDFAMEFTDGDYDSIEQRGDTFIANGTKVEIKKVESVVKVKGHWKKVKGKKVWVKPHIKRSK